MTLRDVELFKGFSDDELERFAEVVQTLNLNLGELLFEEGEPGDALFIVQQGAIRIFKKIDAAGQEEKSLALLEPGTYLGEMTLLDGTPRSASARAEIPSIVLKLTRDDFLKLLRLYPQAAIRLFVSFMQVISQRLRQTNEELVVLYQVGKIIGSAPPLAELVQSILERTMAGAAAAFGVFLLVNDITSKLEVAEARGPGFETVLDIKTGLSEGIAGLAVQEGDIIRIDDADDDTWMADLPRFGYERKAMIVAPLARKGVPIGVLILGDPLNGPEFTAANVNLVQAVTNQAAAAVEASLMHAEADSREKHDRHFFRF